MEISQIQKDLMQHTISGPNRNWFGTSLNCSDSIEFEKLIKAGYAKKLNAPSCWGDDVVYGLTREGREKLNEKPPPMTHALIVKPKWLKLILAGEKTWEIRGTDTKKRGRIRLIESGSGTIVGECEIKATKHFLLRHRDKFDFHRLKDSDFQKLNYKTPWIWELSNPKKYKTPLPYSHPQGAVTWVKLRKI